jgi:hypothetical protein
MAHAESSAHAGRRVPVHMRPGHDVRPVRRAWDVVSDGKWTPLPTFTVPAFACHWTYYKPTFDLREGDVQMKRRTHGKGLSC